MAVNDPLLETFFISVPNEFTATLIKITLRVQISRKSAAEKWVKRLIVSVTKSSIGKCVFFAAIKRPFGGGH